MPNATVPLFIVIPPVGSPAPRLVWGAGMEGI